MTTAILDVRPAVRPFARPNGIASDFVRRFALDRLPKSRRPLICHWHRDVDGRLACVWEPDIPPVPHRRF